MKTFLEQLEQLERLPEKQSCYQPPRSPHFL